MKIQPNLHWNNFTVPELKAILEHCTALERLGIAQDEAMMRSIERDITLREKETILAPYTMQPETIKPPTARSHSVKQPPQEQLLHQLA
jgi:hypothetical protein